MSEVQMLSALVSERLTAAAQEIIALFEKTIAKYEEELCRYKEENQQLSGGPGPDLNHKMTEAQIKEEPEEHSAKQEEEQLPVSLPESSSVCVKTEESSLPLQGHTEHMEEETQGEDSSSETDGDTEHSNDTDNDWEPQFLSLDAEMESETDGDHCNRGQIKDRCTKLETSVVNNGDISGTDEGAESISQCSVCEPYCCSTCKKTFARKSNLVVHRRIHTGGKAYSCSLCNKSYSHKDCLKSHMRTHTGEKLHSCSLCEKSFGKKSHLDIHMRSHTGEKPYSCLFCDKSFSVNSNLTRHLKTHTEEK